MNKSVWTWEGKDQGLAKILADIDKSLVKIEKDSGQMEKAMDKAMKGSARSIDYLKDKMQKLQVVRDNTFDEKKIARYNRELRNTEAQIRRMENLGMSRGNRWQGALGASPIGGQLMGMAGNPYVAAGMAAMATGSLAATSVSYSRNMNIVFMQHRRKLSSFNRRRNEMVLKMPTSRFVIIRMVSSMLTRM
jgi:hypothetical protein